MKYIDQNDFSINNTCVAFGDFDGVHLGHRAVIDKMHELSKEDMTSVIVCYDYDEKLLKGKKILSTQLEKQTMLSETDLEVMISYKIDEHNKDAAVEGFIKEVLVNKLGAKVIVTGKEDKNIDVLRKMFKRVWI